MLSFLGLIPGIACESSHFLIWGIIPKEKTSAFRADKFHSDDVFHPETRRAC